MGKEMLGVVLKFVGDPPNYLAQRAYYHQDTGRHKGRCGSQQDVVESYGHKPQNVLLYLQNQDLIVGFECSNGSSSWCGS